MTGLQFNRKNQVLVAVDIAKAKHDVLIELPSGQRKKVIVQNRRSDFQELSAYLKSLGFPCLIGIEPTADYHRNLAYFLQILPLILARRIRWFMRRAAGSLSRNPRSSQSIRSPIRSKQSAAMRKRCLAVLPATLLRSAR